MPYRRGLRPQQPISRRLGSLGFTLLELLIVIAIIAILLVAIVPAVNSLSKSSGRKGAVSLVLGVIEQARSLAIKDGRATYVVFPAQYPDGTSATTDQNIVSRYFYHSVAIFEDDPNDATKQIQVTEWKILPTGISLRSEISFSNANNGSWTGLPLTFTPIQGAATFPFVKFNSSGGVDSPLPPAASPADMPIQLRLFEGFITGTSEKATNAKNFDESITISRLSGKATYTSANP